MALRLDITDPRGVTAGYHRIISATQVYESGQAGIHINLAGYVSIAYREKELDIPVSRALTETKVTEKTITDKTVTERPVEPVEDSTNKNQSFAVTNTPVFLPFLEAEDFRLGALYTRLKSEIPELSASIDI